MMCWMPSGNWVKFQGSPVKGIVNFTSGERVGKAAERRCHWSLALNEEVTKSTKGWETF